MSKKETQADLLKRYRDELKRSQEWRRSEHYDDLWERMIDLYRGKHLKSKKLTNEDQIVINMAFATINVIEPSVAMNNPKVAVQSRREETAPQAVIAEQVVNYHWRHGKYQPEVRRSVRDSLIMGHGWIKVGYKYNAVEVEVEQAAAPSEDDIDGTVAAEDKELAEEPCTDTNIVIKEDRPFVERVSPFDMFVSPDAHSESELRWICQRIRRVFGQARQDKRYKASARKEMTPSTRSPWDNHTDADDYSKGSVPGGYVDVFEFYDLVAGTVCSFSDGGGDEFLVAPKKIPFSFGSPFIMVRNYDVPDRFYPMGELEQIEAPQYELNETRSQIINHRKKYNPKYVYRQAAFADETAITALKSDDYNTMVPAMTDHALNDTIMALPTTMTPPEFYTQSEMIKSDMDVISGVSDYMRGVMPEVRRTATEAAMLQDSQNARAGDKLSRIEAFVTRIAERVLQVLQQFTDGDQVMHIVGSNGIKLWVHYDNDSIKGEFDFEVEAGSTQPRNESFRRQAAMQMGDALAPFAQFIDGGKMAAYILEYGFGVTNAQSFIVEPPAPPELAGGEQPPMDPMSMGAGAAPQGMQAPMQM